MSPRCHTCNLAGIQFRSVRKHMSPPLLPDVTLVCVDNRTPALALQALRHCRSQLRFARTLLFTDAATAAGPMPDGVQALPVQIDSVPAYSHFMLRGLLPHIHTSHLLVVQWDGYVLDAAHWTPEFLAHDYIGALFRDEPEGRNVGNGGFSLRSRRLLEALQDPRITPTHPEDACIAQQYRPLLEREHGIRFAPAELAARFAFERVAPPGPTFGFHGLFNLPRVMDTPELTAFVDALPDEMFTGVDARDLCKALMRARRLTEAGQVMARRLAAGQRDGRTRQLQARLALLHLGQRLGLVSTPGQPASNAATSHSSVSPSMLTTSKRQGGKADQRIR